MKKYSQELSQDVAPEQTKGGAKATTKSAKPDQGQNVRWL